MGFGHERLDVDRATIAYVGWADHFCEELKRHRNAKDQFLRAFHEESDDCVVCREDTDTDPEGSMQPAHRQPSR